MQIYYPGQVRRVGRSAYWYIKLPVQILGKDARLIEFLVDTGTPREITFSKATMDENQLEEKQQFEIFGQTFNVRQSQIKTKYELLTVIGASFFIKTKTSFKELNKEEFRLYKNNFSRPQGAVNGYISKLNKYHCLLDLKLTVPNPITSSSMVIDRTATIDTGGNIYSENDFPLYLTLNKDIILQYRTCKINVNESVSTKLFMKSVQGLLVDDKIDLVGPTFINNALFWYDASSGKQDSVVFGLAPRVINNNL